MQLKPIRRTVRLTQALVNCFGPFQGLLDTDSYSKAYHLLREDNVHVIDYQIFEIFEAVKRMGGMNPYPKPQLIKSEEDKWKAEKEKWRKLSSSSNRSVTDLEETRAYLNRNMPVTDVELFNPGAIIRHPGGFDLQVRKSMIDHPESGYGVFHEGEEPVLPGTILALYPGTVYFPDNLTQEIIHENEYMISRYDDTVIDGRSWARKNEIATRDSIQLELVGIKTASLERFRNPFGIGNYINHPAPGQEPNVMSYSYDFPAEFPEDLKPFIPNEYHKAPSGLLKRSNVVMHSVLLIAKRKIQNEEILLNYRFNPSNPYPSWYTQPDEEEAARRWGKVKIL
jgi:hypothetical protein